MEFLKALSEMNVDTETTLRRFSGNAAMLERFIRKFPQDKAYGELRQAAEELDYATMEKAVHTLKGTSLNLGLSPLGNACTALLARLRAGALEDAEPLLAEVTKEYESVLAVISELD